jgi:acyl dehydratase
MVAQPDITSNAIAARNLRILTSATPPAGPSPQLAAGLSFESLSIPASCLQREKQLADARNDKGWSPRMIYFEDLEVGAETYFGSYQVTREEVLEFAQKYDPQPFHLSDEAAAATHFGRISASGWHSCAMTMAVVARHVVKGGQAGLGSPGIDELRWLKPVYPGDTLHVRGSILDKTPSRSKPDIGSFRTSTTVTNQDEVPVLTFTSIVLIRRRPPA